MTDREMLLLAFGALKVLPNTGNSNVKNVVDVIEAHLYPPVVGNVTGTITGFLPGVTAAPGFAEPNKPGTRTW